MFWPVLRGVVGGLTKTGASAYAKAFPRTIVGKALGGIFKTAVPAAIGGAAVGAVMGPGMNMPQLPGPLMPGGGTLLPSQFPKIGTLPAWRGPGGKLQAPWSDPRIPEMLKAYSLDDAYLTAYYRAPKGYVVLRDATGKPFACLKQAAKMFGLWHAKAKPPISIRDWHAFQAARRVEKKLLKIAGPALRKRHAGRWGGAAARGVFVESGPGNLNVGFRRKK